MSWKTTAVIGASVIVMAVGVTQALEPRTLKEIEKQRVQQQLDNLSDADEQNKERIRRQGQDGLNSENQRKLIPGEERPPTKAPRPRFRIRIP